MDDVRESMRQALREKLDSAQRVIGNLVLDEPALALGKQTDASDLAQAIIDADAFIASARDFHDRVERLFVVDNSHLNTLPHHQRDARVIAAVA